MDISFSIESSQGFELSEYTGFLLQRVIATVYARQVVDYFICNTIEDDLIELHEQLVSISGAETAVINEIDYFQYVDHSQLSSGENYLKRIEFKKMQTVATETEFIQQEMTRYFHCESISDNHAMEKFKEHHPEGSFVSLTNFRFVSKSLIKGFSIPFTNLNVVKPNYRY